MKKAIHKGFTIVEMLMVLGIIAVLLGLVTSAAMTAIRHARDHKATACLQIIQSGIATYRAQNGEWPGPLKDFAKNGLNGRDSVTYTLNTQEYDQVLSDVVKSSVNSSSGTAMLDVTGLIVAPKGSDGSWGIEFREAIKKQKRGGGKQKIKIADMAFGYQASNGRFSRFKIVYNADSDHVTVTK